jgi:hypothetical protein
MVTALKGKRIKFDRHKQELSGPQLAAIFNQTGRLRIQYSLHSISPSRQSHGPEPAPVSSAVGVSAVVSQAGNIETAANASSTARMHLRISIMVIGYIILHKI